MIYFLKYFKGIAYLLSMLILFQSCVVYTQKPATPYAIEEASTEDVPIKITTTNGIKYKLNWIEYSSRNIFSITNTNRENIKKENIVQLSIFNPEPQIVTLEQALTHQGFINVLVQKNKKFDNHQFIKIADLGDMITGYRMSESDTLTLNIPIDQIEKIQLKDVGTSAVLSVLAFLGIMSVVGGIIIIAKWGIGTEFDFSK